MSTEDLEGDVQVAKYLERYDKALFTNYRAFRLLARGWAGWPFWGFRVVGADGADGRVATEGATQGCDGPL